jgi:hypothetical protein
MVVDRDLRREDHRVHHDNSLHHRHHHHHHDSRNAALRLLDFGIERYYFVRVAPLPVAASFDAAVHSTPRRKVVASRRKDDIYYPLDAIAFHILFPLRETRTTTRVEEDFS